MGYAVLSNSTNVQLQTLIRARAKDTAQIFISEHAQDRMLERRIGIAEIYDVLRNGIIERPWQANQEFQNIECRMERYVGGRNLVVIVALCDEDPDMVVVTTMSDGE